MTPQDALAELTGLGYRLGLRPGGLRLTGNQTPCTVVLDLVREHRDGLILLLQERFKAQSCLSSPIRKLGAQHPPDSEESLYLWSERAAIAEFEGGLCRGAAERLADHESSAIQQGLK